VRTVGTSLLWNQGTTIQTNQPTHLAIEGDGFFKVALPGGNFAYTRDGSFHIDATGKLVTSAGHALEPAITVLGAQDIQISKSGEVSISTGNGPPVPSGTIQLFRFSNRGGLEQLGGNLLRETPASGPELAGNPGLDGMGTLQQRALEGSNVEVVSEMVNLITAQRAYEINSRAIRAGDEMLANTSQLLR
jgi:flagellar basal-body rod protein FlgG